jgi:diaminopimelate epimerase
MKIPFLKYHGARNDFLLTLAPDVPEGDLPKLAVAICDRYTGVGGDGWLIVDKSAPDCDAAIRLFNSDGSEPEISGNGTRCVGALLAGHNPGQIDFHIKTQAGTKHLRLISQPDNEYLFEMNMGEVRVVELHATVQDQDAVILDVGNPQCALPVTNFNLPWRQVGYAIEHDPRFPNRTNVSFVKPVDKNSIEVRFWERGAQETNSSGTGSTGAAVAAVARGLVESPVNVITPAGSLTVRVGEQTWLTGPAEFVAEGVFYVPDYDEDSGSNT